MSLSPLVMKRGTSPVNCARGNSSVLVPDPPTDLIRNLNVMLTYDIDKRPSKARERRFA